MWRTDVKLADGSTVGLAPGGQVMLGPNSTVRVMTWSPGQFAGAKQDRQGADADHDQDELKERRDVDHFKSAKAPLVECAERPIVA